MSFKLYDHQKKQNKAVRKLFDSDKHHILYGATTGFGKSVCIWDFVKRAIESNERVLVLAPRTSLVRQLAKTLQEFEPLMIMNSIVEGDLESKVVVSSKQTTNRRLKRDDMFFQDFDMILLDEAHLGGEFPPRKGSEFSLLYDKFWDKAKWLGFSATPISAQGYALQGWDDVVYKYQTKHLIDMGFLADYDYFAPESIDLSGLKVLGGEYKKDDVEEVTLNATAIKSVKKHWSKLKKTKKILVFASSINHAKLLQEALVGSEIVHSMTKDQTNKEQMEILARFKEKKVGTVINVGILTTGYDDPTIDTIIIARPIKSTALSIQVWGRTLRLHNQLDNTLSKLKGKLEYNTKN